MRNEIILLSTAGSMEVAHRIATALVESQQAACVNIVPGIRSVYRWKGKTCEDGEWLLVIKSIAANLDSVRETIKTLHTYELPEIVALDIAGGDPDYLHWIGTESTRVK